MAMEKKRLVLVLDLFNPLRVLFNFDIFDQF